MTDKPTTATLLRIKSEDAKKGTTWNALTKARRQKQHGDDEHIPAGDAHAVHTMIDPIPRAIAIPEETKTALDSLEKEIQKLKEKQPQIEHPKKAHKADDDEIPEWTD